MCTTELQELRKKTQMANTTINELNAVIEDLIGNNTKLEENSILLKDELEKKNAQMKQLKAHLSFLTLDQKCS